MLLSGALVVFAALVCMGYGVLVLHMAERVRPGVGTAVTVGDLGILGYVALSLLAAVLHLFIPLSGLAAVLPCLLGLGFLLGGTHALKAQARRFDWSPFAAVITLVALCFYLGSLILGSTNSHYDTGLYHLQALRQIMEHPLIWGTANIHMRFGYNSALFQTAALISGGGMSGLAGTVTSNALLVSFVAVAVLQRAHAWKDAACARSTIFGALIVVLAIFTPLLSLRAWAGTPNTDIPSGIMILYGFLLALRLSDVSADAQRSDETAGTTLLLLIAVAFAITLKLSAAPLILLTALPLLLWWRSRLAGRDVTIAGGAALVIGLPWLARGIATSGCLAYPQPSSCLPLPWTVATAVARSDLDWMRAWARKPETLPEIVLADWTWLPGWIASLGEEPARPAFIALAVLAAACLFGRLLLRGLVTAGQGPTRERGIDAAVMVVVATIGIGFWFFSAPLVRYGQSWLIMPILLLIAHFAPIGWRWNGTERTIWQSVERIDGRRFATATALGIAVLTTVSLARRPPRQLLATQIVQPTPVEVRARGIHAGLPIFVPAQGNQCWDAPRICTPSLKDGLVFRPFLRSWMVRDPS